MQAIMIFNFNSSRLEFLRIQSYGLYANKRASKSNLRKIEVPYSSSFDSHLFTLVLSHLYSFLQIFQYPLLTSMDPKAGVCTHICSCFMQGIHENHIEMEPDIFSCAVIARHPKGFTIELLCGNHATT